jgi:hypothetical protein
VSYSIGQVVYSTNTSANGTVIQGVQQPYEISTITAIEAAKDINLLVQAYPNPTTNFLTLSVQNYASEHLSYQLIDMSGKVLESRKLPSSNTTISLENGIATFYIIKVLDNQKVLKTFKVIKMQ